MPDNLTTLPRRPQLPVPEIAAAIEALIELLNRAAGDPELEPNGDEMDQSYPEATGGRGHVISGRASPIEDAEDDDHAEDDGSDSCSAGDDRGTANGGGDDGQPGDPDDAESTHDDEREQMHGCVPCIPVYALEPNIFSGKRQYLGHNNLQPSFRGNVDVDEPPEAA